MIYIKVRWNHSFSDEPILLYSELDENRFETRKIEVFRDGQIGYASKSEKHLSTQLGEEAIPDFKVIRQDEQFFPENISAEEFENLWKSRNGK